MKLYRVSEEPDIMKFIPGLPARADMNRNMPFVRAPYCRQRTIAGRIKRTTFNRSLCRMAFAEVK